MDVIPEVKSKCKDHNEDVSFVCNTCSVVVCSDCVTGSHKGHEFSNLMDSMSQLKENEKDLQRKVNEATQNIKKIEDGSKAFDGMVEVVVKAIIKDGTKIKAMVDKQIAKMVASVKDQSKNEKEKIAKSIADNKSVFKVGSDLLKKIYELEKSRNDRKLLQSLQKLSDDVKKLSDDVAKLTIEPHSEYPSKHYTTTIATDNDIKQILGKFTISNQLKDIGKYLYRCQRCGWEKRSKR
ncbi:E3 ubiquitin-protein ligase TRIM71-like [Mytilus californianus]|uniref:E3 ubiquitin-protein ligase TRIM71-like n=1 Tax=Mytilus californianus TaxID=6549 RepID=UPI002247135A|nr:E3 ubiquitin-protein ligase TRIM71-like [Mytilus californianus]